MHVTDSAHCPSVFFANSVRAGILQKALVLLVHFQMATQVFCIRKTFVAGLAYMR